MFQIEGDNDYLKNYDRNEFALSVMGAKGVQIMFFFLAITSQITHFEKKVVEQQKTNIISSLYFSPRKSWRGRGARACRNKSFSNIFPRHTVSTGCSA